MFGKIFPMLIALFLLIGLFETFITPEMITSLFGHSPFVDMVIGVGVGTVATGQPIISYILGGDLLQNGVSLYAVSAFILSWVTLGITQLPLEWSLFGARFTITRNLLSLVFAFVTAWLTALSMEILS
ncbi:MAG: permease [Campylobacteraceae bacterium 4484_4]|nr:MAG: permease [Campylobacteraceae bacterium 4484_4]